jgi:hypothetical protein
MNNNPHRKKFYLYYYDEIHTIAIECRHNKNSLSVPLPDPENYLTQKEMEVMLSVSRIALMEFKRDTPEYRKLAIHLMQAGEEVHPPTAEMVSRPRIVKDIYGVPLYPYLTAWNYAKTMESLEP